MRSPSMVARRRAACGHRTPVNACSAASSIRIVRRSSLARCWDPTVSPDGGIRTLAANEAWFNPMGYHTGGVWPHDNSIIAAGLAAYGLCDAASSILESQFEASLHFDLQRMPELFCGFERRSGEAPVPFRWRAGHKRGRRGPCSCC
jgi:glycogen debranching enzyme